MKLKLKVGSPAYNHMIKQIKTLETKRDNGDKNAQAKINTIQKAMGIVLTVH